MSFIIGRKRKVLPVLIVLGIFVALAAAFYLHDIYGEYPGANLESVPQPSKETRLLVIAPHCDDETLGCAGLIHDTVNNGGQVKVVVMTNGDGFTIAVNEQFHRLVLTSADYIRSGYTRQGESLQALRLLGMDSGQVVFLGYPDRGLSAMWQNHWQSNNPYRSNFTQSEFSPYSNSFQLNAAYAGENAVRNLEKIINDFKPTIIALPHPDDEHTDHTATWAFAATAVIKMHVTKQTPYPELYSYLVHMKGFPEPYGYMPNSPLNLPKAMLRVRIANWKTYNIQEIEDLKYQAIKQYPSQVRVPIMSGLLHSFVRKNEVFGVMTIPEIKQVDSGTDLTTLENWDDSEQIAVHPVDSTFQAEWEHRGKVASFSAALQDNKVWLRLGIPQLFSKMNGYRLTIISFKIDNNTLTQNRKVVNLRNQQAVLHEAGNIVADNIIIPLTLKEIGNPDFIVVEIITQDVFGFRIDRTGWQPVLIKNK